MYVCTKFVNISRSFHDGMLAHVIDGGDISAAFSVTSGTKQGCVLAPLLFSIFFSLLLDVAFKTCNTGIPLIYRTDRNLFDLRKLQAKNLVQVQTVVRELMFADDCALAAHTIQEAQHLLDCFVAATRRFGLSVSIKKSEVMFQPQVSSRMQLYFHVFSYTSIYLQYLWSYMYIPYVCSSASVSFVRFVESDGSVRVCSCIHACMF